MTLRYVLHPGWIRSKTDGQVHFIGSVALARCYGVPLRECVSARPGDSLKGPWPEGLVHLEPQYDGNYTL